MGERSILQNGRFLAGLDSWQASAGATYAASAGGEQLGVVQLAGGATIAQSFTAPHTRRYTLHVAVQDGPASLTVTDADGRTVAALTAGGSPGVWTQSTALIGIGAGTYTLTVANTGEAAIVVDDVWIWPLTKTRAQIAELLARKLGALASDAALDRTPSGSQTEGAYTDAIDSALRSLDALDPETDEPDIRAIRAAQLDPLLAAAERALLERLQRHYALMVDITVGQRSERLSQIGQAIAQLAAAGAAAAPVGGRRVAVRPLRYRVEDFDLG